MNTLNTKICNNCNIEKSVEDFYKHKYRDNKYTLSYQCKKCDNQVSKNNYQKDHQKRIMYSRKYQATNRELLRRRSRQYYWKNKEEQLKDRKEYYKKNRERCLEQKRIYTQRNHEIVKARKRDHYRKIAKTKHEQERNEFITIITKFPIILTILVRSYENKRLQRKIKDSILKRIYKALKPHNVKKANHTVELLGCSIEEYKKYIESKFEPGMTWENRGSGVGQWQIDHIQFCAGFNLTNIEEQKKCFHYTNTRPLWQKDHKIKTAIENKIVRSRI